MITPTPEPKPDKLDASASFADKLGRITTTNLIVAALIGGVVYKFILSDVKIPWEDYKTLATAALAFIFGYKAAGK